MPCIGDSQQKCGGYFSYLANIYYSVNGNFPSFLRLPIHVWRLLMKYLFKGSQLACMFLSYEFTQLAIHSSNQSIVNPISVSACIHYCQTIGQTYSILLTK